MSSEQYCVYLTTYHGNKLPMFYIGSTTVAKIKTGYRGSVRSKKYREVWEHEIKTNPHLFRTKIVCTFADRTEATKKECDLQIALKVVKTPMYVNMAYATKNGFFGAPIKGEAHPHFGRRGEAHHMFGRKRPEHSAHLKGRKQTAEDRLKKSIANTGKNHGNGKGNLPSRWVNDDTLLVKYVDILRLYASRPDLLHGTCGRNGKLITYEVAFANHYKDQFNLGRQQITRFLTGEAPVMYQLAQERLASMEP